MDSPPKPFAPGRTFMPLSPAGERQLLHTRRIEANGYSRPGGLYDLEAHLIDTKTHTKESPAGNRMAGEPIHEMWLRITIDGSLNITAAEAAFDAVPYAGHCENIAPDYGRLTGLRIAPGFSAQVRSMFAGTQGCTHVSDLIGILATLAFQTMANRRAREEQDVKQPFQLDRCHALSTSGEVVARYYPRWSVKAG
jgi:Protein of unknown function (DUF2889)